MSNLENKRIGPLQKIFLEIHRQQSLGKEVFNLAIGEPGNLPPTRVRNAAIRAIEDNVNGYIPAFGSDSILKALVRWYKKQGIKISKENLVVAGGSRLILDNLFKILIKESPEDVILIPSPYYPSFVKLVEAYDGNYDLVETQDDKWILRAATIEKNILKLKQNGRRVSSLIINSPNNPTGAIIPESEIKKIIRLSEKYGFQIISDECYYGFSDKKTVSFRKFSDKILIVNSASKLFSMVGYRVGWGILPEKISQKIRENLTIHQSSFSSISERAAVAALSGKTSKDFSQSRQFLYDWLDEMGLPYQKTGASFYVFVDCFELIKNFTCKDSLELASYLLEKTGVALAPGQAFGDYSDYLRISYCQPVSVLKKALKSLEKEVGMNG